ncbi:MAG TPA: PQQ-binding-like beta-propeller repeat protein [Bryobacteraceae bacterium]|nr:PQQ-binding-like beta-propeller repeat protein [Bryobacteraceae bacterium]
MTSRITSWRGSMVILLAACGMGVFADSAAAQQPYTTWRTFGGSADDLNYSALQQINRSNVTKLEVAWTYDTGDQVAYGFAPIVVDNTMYGAAHNGSLVAMDATNGKELWVYHFPPSATGRRGGAGGLSAYRGLNYWESKDRSDRRILVQVDGFLQAIDAKTGKLVQTFGDRGRVDLKTGMTRPSVESSMASKSPGQVFENLLILGSTTGEAYGSPPADIRAFDVVTGTLAWVFHTIPHPGEPGYETWPKDAWTYTGGAGNWGEMSIDTKRGIAYIPTGTPKYEFWGGDRHGDTLYGDCVLALDARSGKLLWHYQTVHHDVWEYELVAAPQLLTVHQNGKAVDVVAEASKSGYLYVLNRDTGKPIWPIEERPVPQSDVPGEQLSPTQPFPTAPPPFERMSYTVKDVDQIILTPAERTRWIDIVSKARNEGIFTPFGTNYFSIMMPGHSGGANLFATSGDPETGTAYVISKSLPALERFYSTAAEASKYLGASHYHQTPGRAASAGGGRGGRQPASGTDPAARQGRTTYEQACQQCHGANLAGETGAAPSLLGVVGRLGLDGVRSVIHEGRGFMPTFDTMPDSDMNALLAFLQNPAAAPAGAGAARRGPPAYPPGVDVPPRQFTAYGMVPGFIKPPYSHITAYDLNTGTIKWQLPVGEAVGVNPPGNNFGIIQGHGPKARLAVTAGGLAFSATIEGKIRAYDKDTGKVLWVQELPGPSEGSPAIYEVDGREYVALQCHGEYLAYALPAGAQ